MPGGTFVSIQTNMSADPYLRVVGGTFVSIQTNMSADPYHRSMVSMHRANASACAAVRVPSSIHEPL